MLRKPVFLPQEFYLEQQESRFFQAKMQRNSTLTVTAAVLRAKECVMKAATTVQENAEDIYAEAQQINEERAAKEEEIFEESEQEECAQEEECEQNECEEVKEEASEE